MNTITHRPVRTDITMKEKEAVLRNDQRVASTFQSRAQAEADDVRGRWAQEHKATVIGTSDATAQYPKLPSGPWADPVQIPPEEPLGYDISEAPIVGEPHEIAASIDALGDPATGSHQPASAPRHDERGFVGPTLAAADVPSEVPCSSTDVERAAASLNPKRREP
jgi:hypothetical protein